MLLIKQLNHVALHWKHAMPPMCIALAQFPPKKTHTKTLKYTPFSNPFSVSDLRLGGLDQANMQMPFSYAPKESQARACVRLARVHLSWRTGFEISGWWQTSRTPASSIPSISSDGSYTLSTWSVMASFDGHGRRGRQRISFHQPFTGRIVLLMNINVRLIWGCC